MHMDKGKYITLNEERFKCEIISECPMVKGNALFSSH